MNKFKTGDVVQMKENHYKTGKREIYTVENCYSDRTMMLQGEEGIWYQSHFDLVKAKEPDFCMKTQPWFIAPKNEEEWKVAVDFVKSKGFSFQYDEHYETGLVITNRCEDVKILYGGIDKMIRSRYTEGKNEIKLSYKTVLEKVQYPEVKSAQQLEIEKIEAEMRKLADRLNNLKTK